MWKKIALLTFVIATSLLFSGCVEQLDKRRHAGLQVLTNDVPAALYLDDEYLSDTPYNQKNLQPGSYTLKIVPDNQDFVPYEVPITLRSGLLTAIIWNPGTRPELGGGVIFELERLSNRQQTELTVATIPDGAIVRVNDGTMEFAPTLRTDLTPGKHDITVTLPSYEEQKHTLNMVAGHRLSVLVKLAKQHAEEFSDKSTDESAENPDIKTEIVATESADTTQTNQTGGATASGQVSSQSSQSSESPQAPSPIRTANPAAAGLGTQSTKQVSITSTGFFQNGKEVLRVRDEASSVGKEIGFAEVGQTFPYLNEAKSGWFKIDFNGKIGWVSDTYADLLE